MKAKATLVSFAGLERYREGYPGRPKVCGKNSTAVKRGIQILQQSSELQAGSVAQEAAKACCLDSLSSDRG